MSLIDIKALNAELDKMIATQEAEIAEKKAVYDADNEKKWRQFVADLGDLQEVVESIKCKISIPFAVIHNIDYSFKFEPYYSITVEYNDGNCIAGRIGTKSERSFARKMNSNQYCHMPLQDFIEIWPDIKDDFTHRFEEACVVALKQKAEAANARYVKKMAEYS